MKIRMISPLMSFICLLVVTLVFAQASAKELTNRLGVGYKNSYVSYSLPSVAAVYYPSPNIGVVGALGVDTEDQYSKFAFLGGVRRIIFKEDNMNFFAGGNVALVNQETAGSKDSGFELAALVGGEFFIKGLDSLGFTFESGMGITNVKKTRFRTMGDSFLNAGMIFYF